MFNPVIRSGTTQSILGGFCRVLACIALIAAITYVGFYLLHLNALVAAFTYVLSVLIIAARWGLLESVITSAVAMLFFNYFFIPPILYLSIRDPQSWAALFVFLMIGVTASRLSSSVRERAREAQDREAEVERLYRLSRSLMLIDGQGELGTGIARTIKEEFGFTLVAYCDGLDGGRIDCAGPDDHFLEEQVLRKMALGKAAWFVWKKNFGHKPDEIVAAPVSLSGQVLGSLGILGLPISEPALQAIANLVAIVVERARKRAAEGRLEAVRQNERLKGILLDALAHEFVTPLTSIKGAITTIRSEFQHEADENELLEVVEEEADNLGNIVDETLDIARVEPGRTRVRRRAIQAAQLINASLNRMKTLLDGRAVEVQIPYKAPALSADPELAGLALRQLIANASKYSPPGSPITISVEDSNGMVTTAVLDEGPGIPVNELQSIFEPFYRGSRGNDSIPGMGMGLNIAREIAAAHGGSLKAENRSTGGARFSFTLPAYPPVSAL